MEELHMKRVCKLIDLFESKINGKSMTPFKLKNSVENIVREAFNDQTTECSWYKCDTTDEYEFAPFYLECFDFEIMVDYSGETVSAVVRNTDGDILCEELAMQEYILSILDKELDDFIVPNQWQFDNSRCDQKAFFTAINSLINQGILKRRDCQGVAYERAA